MFSEHCWIDPLAGQTYQSRVNVPEHNRVAWDREVAAGNRWTIPVGPDVIEAARRGEWSIVLTPRKPVPRDWFGDIESAKILCLASGGGQQAPVLAAAGAKVTTLDNSPAQLEQDRMVAERDGLEIALELGLMTDLSRFADGSFDLIFHPVSNVYIQDLEPLWRECFRVLRPGGRLLAGFTQPLVYLFDVEANAPGGAPLLVKNRIPYSDTDSKSPEQVRDMIEANEVLEFSHTLEDQLGGPLSAGFVIHGFYEDTFDKQLDEYISTQAAVLANKPEA